MKKVRKTLVVAVATAALGLSLPPTAASAVPAMPPPCSAFPLSGVSASSAGISGWAQDPDSPDTRLTISGGLWNYRLSRYFPVQVVADGARPGSGAHDFFFDMTPLPRGMYSFTGTVLGVDSAGAQDSCGAQLPNTPAYFRK